MTRRRAAVLLDREAYLRRWAELHGGLDPGGSALVSRWLGASYRLGRPLAAAGVSPTVLTASGAVLAYAVVPAAAAAGRWPVLAAGLVVGSAVLDGLDGTVAVLTGRATRFGYLLDSLADRSADVAYVVALWRLGAPAGLAVAAGATLGWLEYARARAGNAGMGEIGVVSVGERPTRVVLAVLGCLAAGVAPGAAAVAATAAAAATTAVSVVGSAQVVRAAVRVLGTTAADRTTTTDAFR